MKYMKLILIILNKNEDLILKDSDKKRKGIERTTILMENLDYFPYIYSKRF